MSPVADRNSADAPKGQRQHAPAPASKPFLGLIDAVIVEDPVVFPFDGSISRKHAQATWTWVTRDLCPDLLPDPDSMASSDLEAVMPEVLARMRDGMKQAAD